MKGSWNAEVEEEILAIEDNTQKANMKDENIGNEERNLT